MITTVTLNVAVDKAYTIKTLDKGEVMRVKTCTNTAGGKGLNVAKVVHISEEDVVATGFVGGHTGSLVEDLLAKEQVPCEFVHTQNETRCCINILAEDGSSTEFLEPGATVSREEMETFLAKYEKLVGKSDVLTISGSVPQGVPTDSYAKMITIARAHSKKVILDSSGELLKEGIEALPTMIKPNKDEIEALLGISVTNRRELVESAKKLQAKGIELVVVSLGGDGALVVTKDRVLHGKPPKIEPVNTVGCGDSMVAAFAVGLARNYPIEETLRYAIAVSTANALTMKTGHYEPTDRDRILSEVTITQY